MSEWWLSRGKGAPEGPLGTSELVQSLISGQVPPQAYVCRVGEQRWIRISQVDEIWELAHPDQSATSVIQQPWFRDAREAVPPVEHNTTIVDDEEDAEQTRVLTQTNTETERDGRREPPIGSSGSQDSETLPLAISSEKPERRYRPQIPTLEGLQNSSFLATEADTSGKVTSDGRHVAASPIGAQELNKDATAVTAPEDPNSKAQAGSTTVAPSLPLRSVPLSPAPQYLKSATESPFATAQTALPAHQQSAHRAESTSEKPAPRTAPRDSSIYGATKGFSALGFAPLPQIASAPQSSVPATSCPGSVSPRQPLASGKSQPGVKHRDDDIGPIETAATPLPIVGLESPPNSGQKPPAPTRSAMKRQPLSQQQPAPTVSPSTSSVDAEEETTVALVRNPDSQVLEPLAGEDIGLRDAATRPLPLQVPQNTDEEPTTLKRTLSGSGLQPGASTVPASSSDSDESAEEPDLLEEDVDDASLPIHPRPNFHAQSAPAEEPQSTGLTRAQHPQTASLPARAISQPPKPTHHQPSPSIVLRPQPIVHQEATKPKTRALRQPGVLQITYGTLVVGALAVVLTVLLVLLALR